MKLTKLFFILLTVFITLSCVKQRNDLTLYEVSGNVKSIRTTGYEAVEKFGEITEGDVLYGNTLIEFNKDGNITEISYFDNRGDLTKKSIYAFNDKGKVAKISNYDGDGDETGRTLYTYNEDGNVIKIVDYNKAGEINYTQQNEWEDDKCIKSLYTGEYTDGNYIINEFEGHNLVKSVVYDNNGKETGDYTVFEDDKIIKIANSECTSILTYNNKGLCASIVNGQISSTNSYLLLNGQSYIYEYEYDEKGNWIKKVEKEQKSKKTKRIFIREIEYY